MFKVIDTNTGKTFDDKTYATECEAQKTVHFWYGMFYLKVVPA